MLAILILLLLSIICQIVMGVIYHKLIWETENMSTTTNRTLQKLKLKFTSCRQLHECVPNVPVFVDKFINQIKIGRLPLSFLRHISGQLMLLSVLVAGIGACLGIIHNEDFFQIAPFYLISFLGLYCYFAVSSLVDIPGKVKVLRTNLIDYLENHLASRLEQTQLDMRIIQLMPLKNKYKKTSLQTFLMLPSVHLQKRAQKIPRLSRHRKPRNWNYY